MKLTAKEFVLVTGVTAVCWAIALAYGLIVGSPLYWDTVVQEVLQLTYPMTYAYVASAVVSGGVVAAIFGLWTWSRNAKHRPELVLLMTLNLCLFLSSMSDLIFKGPVQHFI
jgi:hypothetical protein